MTNSSLPIDGHIGVVKAASKPIEEGMQNLGSSRSNKVPPRHKRAASQEYSFDFDETRSAGNSGIKNGDMKRRRFIKNSYHSLSDVGSAIMQQSDYQRNSFIKDELNRSMQPASYYPELKVHNHLLVFLNMLIHFYQRFIISFSFITPLITSIELFNY